MLLSLRARVGRDIPGIVLSGDPPTVLRSLPSSVANCKFLSKPGAGGGDCRVERCRVGSELKGAPPYVFFTNCDFNCIAPIPSILQSMS